MLNAWQSLRRTYEVLLSIYSSMLVVVQEATRDGSAFLALVQRPLVSLDKWLFRSVHWSFFTHTDFDPPLFWGTWMSLAVALLLLIGVLGRVASTRIVLWITGA